MPTFLIAAFAWLIPAAALRQVLNTGFVTYTPRPGGRHAH